LRTNVTNMDAIRRRLRSLFRSGSGSGTADADDRRTDSDRRSGDERRERLSLPAVADERRSGSERRSGRDRRDEP
jgi:hypothetical protein